MPNMEHNGKAFCFWIAPELDETISKIAQGERRSKSSVCRDLIQLGLSAGGYQSGSQDIAAMVRDSVTAAMKPQTERLASISAKAAQIAAASFFLAAYTGKLVLQEDLQPDFDEAAAHARKLGVEYLKLSKDKSLDEFIAGGLGRMENYL